MFFLEGHVLSRNQGASVTTKAASWSHIPNITAVFGLDLKYSSSCFRSAPKLCSTRLMRRDATSRSCFCILSTDIKQVMWVIYCRRCAGCAGYLLTVSCLERFASSIICGCPIIWLLNLTTNSLLCSFQLQTRPGGPSEVRKMLVSRILILQLGGCVKIMVPFWILSIVRHLVFEGAQKGTIILTTTQLLSAWNRSLHQHAISEVIRNPWRSRRP